MYFCVQVNIVHGCTRQLLVNEFTNMPLSAILYYRDSAHLLGALEAVRGSAFALDSVSFTHTYLACQGTESQLSDCYGFTQYATYAQSCSTTHAAGVKCLGGCGYSLDGTDNT